MASSALTTEQLERGRSLCREGRFAEGIELFRQVAAAEPANAAAHNFMGMALDRMGKPAEALSCFDRAIAADSSFADALANKADVLSALGRYREAIKFYDRALGIDGQNSFTWLNRGVALLGNQEFDKALSSIDRAIQLEPGLAIAHANRARTLTAMGLRAEALAAIEKAISIESSPVFLVDRGILLSDLGRLPDALKDLDGALLQSPSPAIHARRGFVLLQLGRAQEALAAADAALALDAMNSDALRLRGLAQLSLGQAEAALDGLNRALGATPASPAILNARATVNLSLGNIAAARADAEQAAALDRENHHLAYALGRIQLLQGDWGKAWANYERRLHTPAAPSVPRQTKFWDGAPLKREQLLLLPEGSAGDMIFSARFAKFFQHSAPRITLVTVPELVKLLGTAEGIEAAVAAPYKLESDPVYISYFPLMSSPAAGGFGTERVPADIPYLSADPERIAHFAKLIGAQGLKIGIAWQDPPRLASLRDAGNPAPVLADFAPLAAIPGVRLISLQKGFGSEEIAASGFRARIEQPLEQIHLEHDFMMDAAAVIENVDLVVAPENFAAHLAGALGKKTFTALSVAPSWYWLLEREDSIWYPTMRLFRQTKPREWKDVFERIAQASAGINRDSRPKPLPGLGG